MPAVETEALTKRYGDVVAVDDLTFTVEEGEVYGLVGPNGSGKTTVLNVLLDFVRPTSGQATVLGYDTREASVAVRRRVGVVPEGYGVYDRLTGRQHVRFAVDSKDAEDDPDAILERVGLSDVADRPAGGYSAGMAKRLVLGAALAGAPDLLVFDEPFGGLDPAAAATLRDTIVRERERGTAVLFSSHVFEAVEAICDRFGVLLDGELVAGDDVDDLRTAERTSVAVTVDDPEGAVELVSGIAGVEEATTDDGAVDVRCTRGAKTAVLGTLYGSDLAVTDVDVEDPSLEDVYVAHAARGTGV